MRALPLLLLLALPAAAEFPNAEQGDVQSGPAIGYRMPFYRPKDADVGTWGHGIQGRASLAKGTALELSLDRTSHTQAGVTRRVVPLQATLIGYFSPEQDFSPYLLLGYGWYWERQGGVTELHTRPHAGGGVQWRLWKHVSVEGSYRLTYHAIWKYSHPYGDDYSERGAMWTLAANWLF